MDEIDLSVYRWMYPRGVWSRWGIDPRITTAEIARHVSLDRTAVWARVRRWKREGFWNGLSVGPNPAIFGVEVFRAEMHVADPAEGSTLLDELDLVDGVLGASLHFGDSATARNLEVVVVGFVAENPAGIARRMRILGRMSPNGSVNGPFLEETFPCLRALTPLDWRIIAALVDNPNASVSRVARLVGVSLKTAANRHSALIDEHALFYAPMVDWSKLPCLPIGVLCREEGDVHRVRAALEVRFPHQIPMSVEGTGYLGPEYASSPWFACIIPVRSPLGVQPLVRDLSKLPGVKAVRPDFLGALAPVSEVGQSAHRRANRPLGGLPAPSRRLVS